MKPTGIPKKSHLLYWARQGTKCTRVSGERVQPQYTTFLAVYDKSEEGGGITWIALGQRGRTGLTWGSR